MNSGKNVPMQRKLQHNDSKKNLWIRSIRWCLLSFVFYEDKQTRCTTWNPPATLPFTTFVHVPELRSWHRNCRFAVSLISLGIGVYRAHKCFTAKYCLICKLREAKCFCFCFFFCLKRYYNSLSLTVRKLYSILSWKLCLLQGIFCQFQSCKKIAIGKFWTPTMCIHSVICSFVSCLLKAFATCRKNVSAGTSWRDWLVWRSKFNRLQKVQSTFHAAVSKYQLSVSVSHVPFNVARKKGKCENQILLPCPAAVCEINAAPCSESTQTGFSSSPSKVTRKPRKGA